MKVIEVNAVYGTGSTGVIVRDIEQLLIANGHETCVAYQRALKCPKHGFQIGNIFDWKCHALYSRIMGKQAYASKHSTKKLIQWLKIQNPDIVHLHNLHSNFINLNMLLEYLAEYNIQTVLTLHDCWFMTGKCCHFVSAHCDKWKTKCCNCPQNKNDVKSLFFDQTEKVFEDKKNYFQKLSNLTVVGCSDWICSLAEQSPVFDGKRILRIYNGVDTEIFNGAVDSNDHLPDCQVKPFIIMGMANKWFQEKNHSAVSAIINSLKKDDKVILVGCTQEQVKAFSGDKRVTALGYISDRKQLADIYSSADVFVNLTFEDTLPTVNMESICCGTPVVTYDSCGSPELIQEGKTGYVVPALNIPSLLHAIDQVQTNHISSVNCAQIGRTLFDKNTQYLKYLDLFNILCDSKIDL